MGACSGVSAARTILRGAGPLSTGNEEGRAMTLDDTYSIRRRDQWNWVLIKRKLFTAKSDTKKHKAGEHYIVEETLGYYPRLAMAFGAYVEATFNDDGT